MAKVVRLVKTIRTNWKKSIFFTSVGLYGLNYAKGKYEDGLLRTAYCEEAKKYGDVTLKTGEKPKKVTVFLNPAVRNGKGKKLYDKNVAPVLNMAGLEVNVVRTEYEGQAKKFMTVLDATDAIVVAGGDGTLSEVLTGLLRREDKEEFANIPIGFIPLGYTNTLSKSLLPGKLSDVAAMLEASFSVVRGTTRPTDILCVKGEEDKTVYTATGLHWGAFTDAASRKKKYWYMGGLKERFTFLRFVMKSWPPLVQGQLTYSLPCEGCSKCYVAPPKIQWKWWHMLFPPRQEVVTKDYSDVINESCGEVNEVTVSSLEFVAETCNCTDPYREKEKRDIEITMEKDNYSRTDFISEGWRRITDNSRASDVVSLKANSFQLKPIIPEDKESWFCIDQEQFEAMQVQVELLPHKLRFFFSTGCVASLPEKQSLFS